MLRKELETFANLRPGKVFPALLSASSLKKEIVSKDLFSANEIGAYYFSGGWHIKALYSLFVAFIFSAATIWNPDFRYLQSYSWLIGAFASFITYYLLANR